MKPVEVVESRRWKNVETGATASPYGAVPWTSEAGRPSWVMETVGFTLRMSNGTVGFGRPPFKTRGEAEAYMAKWLADLAKREAAFAAR